MEEQGHRDQGWFSEAMFVGSVSGGEEGVREQEVDEEEGWCVQKGALS